MAVSVFAYGTAITGGLPAPAAIRIVTAVGTVPDLLAVDTLRSTLATPTGQQISVVRADWSPCTSIGLRARNVPNVVSAGAKRD
jgi:hypothetical protein